MSDKRFMGAIMIALGIFMSWAWTLPSYQAVGALKAIISEKQAALDKKKELIKKVKDMYDQYKSRTTDIEQLSFMIPTGKGVPEVLTTLETLAANNGLQLKTVTFNDQKGPPGAPYDIVAFDVDFEGPYLSLVSFLTNIEKNIRLIDVISVDVTPGQSTGGPLGLKIKMNAYKVNQDKPAATPVPIVNPNQ